MGIGRVETHAERLILHVAPAGADAEAQPAAGEHVHLRPLFGDEGGLSLAEHEHAGGDADAPGYRRQVTEHDERLVERVLVRVGWGRWLLGQPPSFTGLNIEISQMRERYGIPKRRPWVEG